MSTPEVPRTASRHMVRGLAILGLAASFSGVASVSASAADWPQLRGDGRGHSSELGLPLTWSEEHNTTWKTPLPGRGWSSPVVVGNRVWLTTALEDEPSLRLLGLDASSGDMVHDIEVFRPEAWQPGHLSNSYASPTPAADGEAVCVHFGTYGTGCYSLDGRLLWKRQAFVQEHEVGPGSSPILWRDLLIVNSDATDSQFIAALDKHTGEEVWRTLRHMPEARKPPHRKAFSTPVIFRHRGRTLLLSTGAAHSSAYDAATGEEVWWLRHEGYSNVPMPLVGLGSAFVTTGFSQAHLLAIRLGGEGDVSDSHLRWDYHWQVPTRPSLLLVGSRIFMVNDQGNATWLDAVRGEAVWRQRLGGHHSASPLYVLGRIYVFAGSGATRVVNADDAFEILATNQLDGEIYATPAIAQGALFIRTDSHLYRIQDLGDVAKEPAAAAPAHSPPTGR